jgi:RES domain-containing protein
LTSAWRISKAKYADPPSAAFDGEGAKRRGGRWTPPGRRVAYASSSLALATLEYFVNLDPEDAPAGLVSIRVDIPSVIRVESIDAASLPANWQTRPYPTKLQEIGERWLQAGGSVCLSVPSVVVPQEANLLINPTHRDFILLTFHAARLFEFDPRMFK